MGGDQAAGRPRHLPRREEDHPPRQGAAGEPGLRHGAPLVRDELVLRQPDPCADRALDRVAETLRQVSGRRICAAQAPGREGGPAAAEEAQCPAHRAHRRAGALYRGVQGRSLQGRPLPLLKRPSSASPMPINSIWNDNYAAIALHLVIALAAGGIIGLERSYHGRPAGFRTHALVCLSSCMLMVLTVYQDTWFSAYSLEHMSVDPTRMAQGIMTGIGFLGAGIGTALTLVVLSGFRWIERRMPIEFYANLTVAFLRNAAMPESELRPMVERQGFVVANMNYSVTGDGKTFEYQMVIHSPDRSNTRPLSEALNALPSVTAFRIAPTGD